MVLKINYHQTSLMFQWLRLHASTAGSMDGFNPWWGKGPQATQRGQNPH